MARRGGEHYGAYYRNNGSPMSTIDSINIILRLYRTISTALSVVRPFRGKKSENNGESRIAFAGGV